MCPFLLAEADSGPDVREDLAPREGVACEVVATRGLSVDGFVGVAPSG